MSSHCGHCRKKTPSRNPVQRINAAGRPMIHTTCTVCGHQQLPRAVNTGATAARKATTVARRSCVAKCRTKHPKSGKGLLSLLPIPGWAKSGLKAVL